MTINRWLGTAQARVAKTALQPVGIQPGSIWILRVGSQSFSYTYPASIETYGSDDNDRAQDVCDGLVAAFSGGGTFGGGSSSIVGSIATELYQGRWSVMVTGTSEGAPLDVDLTGSDPVSSGISIVRLQAGRAAQNEIQRIKFPGTPSSGTWFVRFRNSITSALAYNITNANLQTALEGLASIGSGNVTVSGSYTAGYLVTFQGTLAATDVDLISAYSDDFAGVASYKLDITSSGGIGRQEYSMPDLSGDANTIYRFSYDGSQSHYFTGAATTSQLLTALESISTIGSGNVYVQENVDKSYTIALIGSFVGRAGGTLSLVDVSNGDASTDLTASTPTFTTSTKTVVVTILNMPYWGSGTLTFSYNGATTAAITYNGATSGTVQSALTTASIPWVCTAVAGGQYGARSFTFTLTGSVDPGVILPDVSSLVGCYAIDVRTTQPALVARNEVQQINIETDPTGGTFTLAFGANTSSGIAYNASASTIQTTLQGLASIGASNATVSGAVGGPFVVEFVASLAAAAQNLIVGNGASLTRTASASVTSAIVTVPTGPNWWTNTSNWSLGSVPSSTHVATFDAGSVGCRYGISAVAAIAGIDVYRSYTGSIGLPERKDDGSPETLSQYLSLTDLGSAIPIRIGLGDEGAGPSVIRINTALQHADVSLLFSSSAGGEQLYTVGLAGLLDTLHVADASLQIATAPGSTATVGSIRISPKAKSDDAAVVEWGEGAAVSTTEIVAGTVRMGSVPASLTIHSGQASVRGSTGALTSLVLRNCLLRYLAGGSLGKFGTISALTTSSGQARLTCNSHGLSSGDRIFLRGVVGVTGLPDGYYTILRVDANTFDLVGTAPAIPFGASSPSTVSSYYQTNTAQWGLADAVRIGSGGTLDFSELSTSRTIVAPVLLQASDAQVIDTLNTVSGLRIKSDPGLFDVTLGNRALIKRE
jgi:trimeric autotransporter adhesin